MALILADGFDFYTAQIDAMYVGSPWISYGQTNGNTPYGSGQSVWTGSNPNTTVLLANESTIYFSLSLMTTATFTGGLAQGFKIYVYDTGGTAQCVLSWDMDGNFSIQPTSYTDTPIAGTIWPHGMAPNSWCHWQVKLVIHNTAGSVELRKNNNPVNDFTKTGINTRNGTANSYANKYLFSCIATWYMDDLFMCSGSGAVPNTWPGQLRAVQLVPENDTAQKNMLPSIGSVVAFGPNSTAGTQSCNANAIYFPYTTYNTILVGGTVTKMTLKLSTGFTGKMRCAIYTVDGSGNPLALVGQTNEVTNPVTGDNDFTFAVPPTVQEGPHTFGFWANAAFVPNTQGGSFNLNQANLNYASNSGNFPATIIFNTSGGLGSTSIRATINIANYTQVNELKMNSDTDYVYSSNPGDLDVYDMSNLTVNPLQIPLVVTKVSMKKSDAGTRTACTQFRSGAVVQDQPSVNLAVTYGWQMRYFPTNPDTAAAWTQATVNAIQIGVKVLT